MCIGAVVPVRRAAWSRRSDTMCNAIRMGTTPVGMRSEGSRASGSVVGMTSKGIQLDERVSLTAYDEHVGFFLQVESRGW